jgi:hypothetical protein
MLEVRSSVKTRLGMSSIASRHAGEETAAKNGMTAKFMIPTQNKDNENLKNLTVTLKYCFTFLRMKDKEIRLLLDIAGQARIKVSPLATVTDIDYWYALIYLMKGFMK